MTNEEIIRKYALYLDAIQKMGKFAFRKATVRQLGLKRGDIQRAYKEMHKIGFKGPIQSYLGYISTQYVFYLMRVIEPNQKKVDQKRILKMFKQISAIHPLTCFNFCCSSIYGQENEDWYYYLIKENFPQLTSFNLSFIKDILDIILIIDFGDNKEDQEKFYS